MTDPVAVPAADAGQSQPVHHQRPRPRPAIRVGVVGARKFGPDDGPPPPWIPDRLKHVFGVIASELHCLQLSQAYFDKTERPLVRVLSGLADGADQVGARVALEASD